MWRLGAGPLMTGNQHIERASQRQTPAGTLRLLTPTDCVKDRLAAFYYWNDRQSLQQAVLVAASQEIDLADVRRWSRGEKSAEKFRAFERLL